ncbi:MAG: HEAT repeat domain-containing protein [Alphaproteobacteria bacterium]|nr:HEAT repeat domain-containing protein [Alphaproteobacteria bacterium]
MSADTDKFVRIIRDLDRLLVPGAGEKFWSARAIFSEMDSAFLNGWSHYRLQEILDDKEFLVFRDRNSLTINVTKGYAVSLAMIDRPPSGLYLHPQHYMARNVGRVPATIHRYKPDRPLQNDVYDPNARLELLDVIQLQPGEALERNGNTDVLDWKADGEMAFVLRLHSESVGDYEWAFDRETLAPKGVTVLDRFSSQMTTAMQMLTALGAPVGRDFIETGLSSPQFHVRWETVKMISQLSPDLVREAIERLKEDPHPAIRRAIEKSAVVPSQKAGH